MLLAGHLLTVQTLLL